eukprot:2510230-Rhodomonas_salina.1
MLCASCSVRMSQFRGESRCGSNGSFCTRSPRVETEQTAQFLYGKDSTFYGMRIVIGRGTASDYGGRVSQHGFNPGTGKVEVFFVPGTYDRRDGVHGTVNVETGVWTKLSPSIPFSIQ